MISYYDMNSNECNEIQYNLTQSNITLEELKKITMVEPNITQQENTQNYNRILITGDTHGDGFNRIRRAKTLGADMLIICGDFGYIWNNPTQNEYYLKVIDSFGIKVLFIDGNHEDFNELEKFPYSNMFGGKVQIIRENIFHLLRGEIYNINNKSIFTMGGAASTDKGCRIENLTWWKQEIPNNDERSHGMQKLRSVKNKVDIIITHTGPSSILEKINGTYRIDEFTDYLELIDKYMSFNKWYFGHMHINKDIDPKHTCLFDYFIDFNTGEIVK